ncbi:hypothetical protein HDA40_007912 [Hamadaea flava]|uniref:Uncharacterized protein n=1 Tax=Hamadaea flava TaxID=1742688 RepID=A0ABV8M035_9ACTN|nr:hypothetical protein [Hamadaea flava]MCP2329405.1 hypothetical protein [Hamadaea flava]
MTGDLLEMVARPKDGAIYDAMPDLDGVLSCAGQLLPDEGTATLQVTDHVLDVSWNWTFRAGQASAQRWRELGISPVVWHFSPPATPQEPGTRGRTYRAPALVLAVDRDVTIEFQPERKNLTAFSVKRPEYVSGPLSLHSDPTPCQCHPSHHQRALTTPQRGVLKEGYQWVSLSPHVEIIRVQNPALMPSFDRPESIFASYDGPYLIKALQSDPTAVDTTDFSPTGELTEAAVARLDLRFRGKMRPGMLVAARGDGLVIQSLENNFFVEVKVKDPMKPAAFAHTEIQQIANFIMIKRDKNIDIKVTVDPGIWRPDLHVMVYAKTVAHDEVPIQGALPYEMTGYEEIEDESGRGGSPLTMFIDMAISAIPVVGIIYDLGQLSYMIATGKNFWGAKVSSVDIVLSGVFAVGALGLSVGSLVKSIRARAVAAVAARLDNLADQLPEAVLNGPLFDVMRQMPKGDQEALAKALGKALEAGDAVAGVKAVQQAVAQTLKRADATVKQAIVDGMVRDLFTEDLSSFRNTFLRVSFDTYKIKNPTGILTPVAWLRSTKGMWVNGYMRQMLGSNWKIVLAESLGLAGSRVKKFDQAMLKQYDLIVSKGLIEYAEAKKLVAMVPGLGRHVELDHLVEQRFIRQSIEWVDALPEDAALMVFPVPKNAAAAAEILRIDPSSKIIEYVHTAKTDVMRQLIPHGAEHLFTVQQIADATLYTLKSLGAHKYLPVTALRGDFAMLALARATNIDAHALAARKGFFQAANEVGMPKIRKWSQVTAELVSPANGFPRVARVNGVWRVVSSTAPKP